MIKRFDLRFQLQSIRVVLEVVLTMLLVVTGLLGLVISFINPIQWITDRVPTAYHPTLASIDSLILSLNTNFIPVISTSSVILLLGIIQPNTRRGFKSIPSKVLNAYRKVCVWRDWIFSKIEYLNGESAKWRRAFNIAKSPYTLLRALGLNPQMAIGLLAVGSTAGTGVIVNETVLAERSFSNGDSGVYLAPLDTPSYFDDKDNTLRINLGAVPVREITIENVSAGTVYSGDAAGAKVSALPATCGSNGSTACTEAVLI